MDQVSHGDSIPISIPDGNSTTEDGQPSGQDGGHRTSAIARYPTVEEILALTFSAKDTDSFTQGQKLAPSISRWKHIFIISCLCAILIDPLFCYLFLIHDDIKCVKMDQKFVIVYIILRSVSDTFYMMDLAFKGTTLAFVHWKAKKLSIKILASTLISSTGLLFISLPIPQIVLFTSSNPMRAILAVCPYQYALRVFLIFKLPRLPPNLTGISRWVKHFLLPFPFFIAAQLVGSGWYFLAVLRLQDCWKDACKKTNGCDFGTNYHYFCNDDNRFRNTNITVLNQFNALCPISSANATVFDFGIFLYALQTNMTRSRDVPVKVLQSFWWALRNLSSLGSNLQTSVYGPEIMFSIYLFGTGVWLFVIYFNVLIQAAKERSKELQLRWKARRMQPEIDLWLSKNALHPADLKKTIMNKLTQTIGENSNINANDILSILPFTDRRKILSRLRLISLKKVPEFENMDERVLKAMCYHLKPVTYTEDSYIIREGEPLEKVLFITQGSAWCYTASGNTSSSSTTIECLEKGNFYGKELIEWFLIKFASFSDFPVSARTVKAQTKVEGFVIRANDLKTVLSKFWWYFSSRHLLSQLEDSGHLEGWQNLAVSSLQTKWRQRHVRPEPETLSPEENHENEPPQV